MPLFSSLSKPVVKVRYQFLKKKHEKSIVEELVKARSALVFMPEKIEHFGAALQFSPHCRAGIQSGTIRG